MFIAYQESLVSVREREIRVDVDKNRVQAERREGVSPETVYTRGVTQESY